MKSFQEWLAEYHNLRHVDDWDEMPQEKKLLIHLDRTVQAQEQVIGRYEKFVEDLLGGTREDNDVPRHSKQIQGAKEGMQYLMAAVPPRF